MRRAVGASDDLGQGCRSSRCRGNDGATNTVTATVDVGGVPGGVAVDPATNTVYVTNESGGRSSAEAGVSPSIGDCDTRPPAWYIYPGR